MIECGFEFEFGHDITLDLIKQIIKFYYPHNKIYTLDETSEYDKILSKHYFIFKEDSSVNVFKCKYHSTEMVTPVFKGKKEILQNFKKIFNILKILQIQTNFTCSLHINIGFSDNNEIEKINVGKLFIYINEKYWLKIFKRNNNIYCRKCLSDHKCIDILNTSKNNIQLIKNFEKAILFLDKLHGQTLAFDKCKKGKLSIIPTFQ